MPALAPHSTFGGSRSCSSAAGTRARPTSPAQLRCEKIETGPRRIREIQVTFDTGFQRELTLKPSDRVDKGIICASRPETVRDYAISGRQPGKDGLTGIVSVSGNHQRLNRHRLDVRCYGRVASLAGPRSTSLAEWNSQDSNAKLARESSNRHSPVV